MPETGTDPVEIARDILHDMRLHKSYGLTATPKQLQLVNIILRQAVDNEMRVPVLAHLLRDPKLTSTKQLLRSDARAFVDWATNGRRPCKGLDIAPALDVLRVIAERLHDEEAARSID